MGKDELLELTDVQSPGVITKLQLVASPAVG
jgi:hypothetical protein